MGLEVSQTEDPLSQAILEVLISCQSQTRLKLQIADGKVDSTVKHWSQQMSAAVNREASRNVTRKASHMVDKASLAQKSASATIDSGDDFSHQLSDQEFDDEIASINSKDNEDDDDDDDDDDD